MANSVDANVFLLLQGQNQVRDFSVKSNIWKTLPLFLIIFLVAGILLFLVALGHYWQVTLKEKTAFENNEVSTVQQGKTAIQQQLAGVVSDINYLTSYGEHYSTSYGKALSLFDNDPALNQQLTQLLYTFSKEKKVYDQIRFLDPEGAELIRINNNNGTPYPVTRKKLQKKSTRYYFQEISQLKKGELYISPLDLNIEKGKIERPFKPVLRFGEAVFNAHGDHKGSLLLNFMGEEILTAFRDATESHQNHIMLLNNKGDWLSSPNRTQEWGFMFGIKKNFSTQFSDAWQTIKSNDKGQFYNSKHLLTFNTVNPLPETLQTATTPRWKIVSLVPQSNPVLGGAFDKYVNLYGSILFLLGFGAWILASTILRHRQSELQVEFEQRFRQVLEHVDLLAIALDKNGTITFCNKALSKLLGWNRDEILGKNWFDTCVPKESKSQTMQLMHDISSGKIEESHEDALVQTKAGNKRKVEWNHTLMRDTNGDVIGLTCIGENVTEIRAQEKQLLTLSRAIEQSPVVVLIVNTNGEIEYTNPRFTEVTGYTMEEALGKNPSILKSEPHTNKEEYDKLWMKIQAGGTWHGIFKNRKKNGDIYWASASISGLRDNNGKIVNYIGVQEDITERLNLEEKFRMSVEGSPYAIVMIDEAGNIILINSQTEKYFGYKHKELMGQAVEMLIPEQYLQGHVKSREKFLTAPQFGINNNHVLGRRLFGKRKNGSEFPVEIALNLIDTDEGKITLASIIDITQRTKLESELEERNNEIAKSKTLAVVGRMASMVAHDLRNPLSSIKMGLQILSKPMKAGSEAHKQELKTIALEQVGYMEVILEDLLNYARPPALKLEWLDIKDVLNETTNMLQGLIQENQAVIHTNVQQGLPTIYADLSKLRLILSNTISNGIQAAAESGNKPEINLTAMSRLGDKTPSIQIEITDNGPGIDSEKVETLFEPFYTSRARGTGLGLAIVKGFVEQHQGQITLNSIPNKKGTICTISLPISALMTPIHQVEK